MNKYNFLFFCFLIVLFSCKEEEVIIGGCTDSVALNYSANANSNDGSCIYAYNIAQGIWNINPDCEEYTIPVIGTTISLNDQLPETIDVQGGGNNSLYIDLEGTQVSGDIDNYGNIIVPLQTISIDMGLGATDVDVEGNGIIFNESSGNMDLTYSFEVPVPVIGNISQSLDCSITLSK